MNAAPEPGDRVSRAAVAYMALCGVFLVSLVVANLITAKLFVLFGVVLAAGIIPYPVTFLATDLISEVFGRKRADAVVLWGFVLSLYVLIVIKIGQYAVPHPEPALGRQHEYETIFGNSARAIIASMVAYLVAQLLDVRMFHFWKRLTGGKHLWLRNNASTMASQLVDSVLVVSILFWGQMPVGDLIKLIGASYLFKFVNAGTDTPLFYMGDRYLRAAISEDIPWPAPKQRALDAGLLLATLGNIALMVSAATLWHPGPVGSAAVDAPGVGAGLLALGVAGHVSITVALARPDLGRRASAVVAALGIGAFALAWTGVAAGDRSSLAVVATAAVAILGALLALAHDAVDVEEPELEAGR